MSDSDVGAASRRATGEDGLIEQVRHDMSLLAARVEDYTAEGLRIRLLGYADSLAARSGGTR